MGGVQGRKRVHPRMGSLKSEQEQLARGRNPSQAINWSKQARLHPAEGLSHQEPWPLARSMLKADLERLPALRANSTCLTSETLERDGWGARGKGQALRGLYLQPWTLAPSTHLVWGGMGHTRSPPRRLPHCHSSPLGQSTLAGGWHTGKKRHGHLSPLVTFSAMYRYVPGKAETKAVLPTTLPPHSLPEGTHTQERVGESQLMSRKEAKKPAVHSTKPET